MTESGFWAGLKSFGCGSKNRNYHCWFATEGASSDPAGQCRSKVVAEVDADCEDYPEGQNVSLSVPPVPPSF